MNENFNEGTIEIVVGAMFSGKSAYLIERGKRMKEYGSVTPIYLKPGTDTRQLKLMFSRNGNEIECIQFKSSRQLEGILNQQRRTALFLIDEIQFAEEDILKVLIKAREGGHNVVVAGLPTDFRGLPFGPTPEIMSVADRIISLKAVCSVKGCNEDGIHNQRIRNGIPDRATSPTIVIEGSEDEVTYEVRCRKHRKIYKLFEYLQNNYKK